VEFFLNGNGLKSKVLTTENDNEIWIHAKNIRRERTGVHATIEIVLDTTSLAWSQFNIERDEDRGRLANKAYRGLGTAVDSSIYPKEYLAHEMDLFCRDLWEAYIATSIPDEIEGDATSEPLKFVLKPYIMEGGGTILFGPPGRGKSYTSQLIAVSIDSGEKQFWEVEQTKTLLINLERSASSIRRRLGCVNTVLGLDPQRKLLVLNARGKSLADLKDVLERTVARFTVGFIVLDSISRAGYGDLNENRPVNSIVDTLNNLCPTWLALAHTPRADETHVFGSQMFDAGADVMVQLLSQVKGALNLGVGLQVKKANDMGPVDLSVLSFTFDDFGLSGVRYASPREFLEIEAQRKIDTTPMIQEFLLDMGPSAVDVIAEHVGKDRSTVQKILSKEPLFTVVNRTGRAHLWNIRESNRS